MQEMDQELERYNKCNAQLELTISDLKLKNEGLMTEVTNQRSVIGQKVAGIKGFQHDLHSAAQSLQVCPLLKMLSESHFTAQYTCSEITS
jgi:hypothetical protein